MAGRHTGRHGGCTRPVPERREAAAAAARDAGTAVAKPADGARAARARQVAHRGRAECVESCKAHRTHRISKGAGRAGKLESLLGREGAGGDSRPLRDELLPEHLVALCGVRRHLREGSVRNDPEKGLRSAKPTESGRAGRAFLSRELAISGLCGSFPSPRLHSRQPERASLSARLRFAAWRARAGPSMRGHSAKANRSG